MYYNFLQFRIIAYQTDAYFTWWFIPTLLCATDPIKRLAIMRRLEEANKVPLAATVAPKRPLPRKEYFKGSIISCLTVAAICNHV